MSTHDLPKLGLVIVGHVDAGKSTLCGRLLYEAGTVDKRQMAKMETHAASMGRVSFSYAFLMDTTKAEQTRGVTIDVGLRFIYMEHRVYQIVDAPGHRDFVKNMITGASNADSAILVVDSSYGGFEAGISSRGQTRQHLQLLYAAGITNLVVVVNKMDTIPDDEQGERFSTIRDEIASLLKKIGFFRNIDSVPFIPLSAFKGWNLIDGANCFPWYNGWTLKTTVGKETTTISGRTLFDVMDKMPIPPSPADAPMRAMITDSFLISGIGPIAAVALHYGIVKPAMQVVLQPGGIAAVVKTVECDKTSVESFSAPGAVGLNLKLGLELLKRGVMIGDAAFPPRMSITIVAKVIVLEHPTRISVNYCPVMSFHSQQLTVKVLEITVLKAGKLHALRAREDSNQAYLATGDTGQVVLKAMNGHFICEQSSQFPRYQRFSIRDSGIVVAVGFVVSREVVENAPTKGKGAAAKRAPKKAVPAS